MSNYFEAIAEAALAASAIRLSASEPFTWTTGYRMPIYNDNRLLLGSAQNRALIAEGFIDLINKHNIQVEVIAGTATAGIPHATTLADQLKLPLIYVREKPKGHGMHNRIEGGLKQNQQVLLIEDLISTGKSSLNAVEAVREAGGEIHWCLSIFSYGFEQVQETFRSSFCKLESLLTFEQLLSVAVQKQYISSEDQKLLAQWRLDPFGWGDKNGFPKVVKD